MRNEETGDASFRVAEEETIANGMNVGAAAPPPQGSAASGSAASAQAAAEPGSSTAKPTRRKPRSLLGVLSYVLSAAMVVGAFGFLMASGLSGRFSSLAQTKPAGEATAQQVASLAPAEPAVQAVPVLVGIAEKRSAPITADAVGKVESIASITVRTRVDGQIAKVLFEDGQPVKQGDVLYELDARQIDAQIRQAEAVVAKDKAQIVQTQRDMVRNDTLAKTNAGSILNLQNAQTAEALAEASLQADQAALENLRVQRSYYTIISPVTGRAGIGIQREGSAIRTGDSSGTLVTVNQIKPIYVNFSLPQRLFAALQSAAGRGGAKVVATVQGSGFVSSGRVVAIDNSADSTSGNIGVRASFDNVNEGLWPGLLCSVSVTLGHDENAVIVPRDAVQSSQNGNIVFVVEHGTAKVKTVTIDRFEGASAILSAGLDGGETVVTDGQLRLTDGTPVSTQQDKRRRGDPS